MRKIHYLLLIAGVAGAAITTKLVYKSADYQPRAERQLEEMTVKTDVKEFGPAYEYINSMKINLATGTYTDEDVNQALSQIESMSYSDRRLASPFDWRAEGPDNVGGRTRAFLIDQDDPNIMYSAGVSGGLFRSTTAGASWTPVNDFQDELFVVSITQDKDGYIYYGVGEAIFPGGTTFRARGIYKSETKDGLVFKKLTGTSSSWSNVGALNVNKESGILYAGSSSGFYYSEDGGAKWTKPSGLPGSCRDIEVASDGTVFAHVSQSVYRSADGKGNFTKMNIPTDEGYLNGGGRTEIAISPQDANYVYVVVASNAGNLNGLYGTQDKGDNWKLLVSGGSPFNDALSQTNTLDGQGIYDLTISVDPRDKDHVYYGGVQFGEYHPSYGGRVIGSTFASPNNSRYIHADKHLIEWDMSKTPPTMIVGTDGGLFFSYNSGKSFTQKNLGYITTQFYAIAANRNGDIFGGTQDNSCIHITHDGNSGKDGVSMNGKRLLSGDGFQTEFSEKFPLAMIGESQYGNVRRSNDGGKTFECFWDSRIGSTAEEVCDRVSTSSSWAPFNTELGYYEWDSMVHLIDTALVDRDTVINGRDTTIKVEVISEKDSSLFISRLFYSKGGEVWMCDGALDFLVSPRWFKIANGFSGSPNGYGVSPDGNSVFFTTTGNRLYRIDGIQEVDWDPDAIAKSAIAPGITRRSITSGVPTGRTLTSVTVNPDDKDHVLLTLGNYVSGSHVYESKNGSSANPTFASINSNLPAMPVYDGCLVTIDNKVHYVLGTEFGVWASDNAGSTWTEENKNLARIPVYEVRAYQWLDWQKPSIFIATHGRGAYSHNSPFHVDYTDINDDIIAKENKEEVKTQLTVYPNPATSHTTVEFNAPGRDIVDLKIYDIRGQLVLKQRVANTERGNNLVTVHTSGLKAGNYFVKVEGKVTSGYAKLVVVN